MARGGEVSPAVVAFMSIILCFVFSVLWFIGLDEDDCISVIIFGTLTITFMTLCALIAADNGEPMIVVILIIFILFILLISIADCIVTEHEADGLNYKGFAWGWCV